MEPRLNLTREPAGIKAGTAPRRHELTPRGLRSESASGLPDLEDQVNRTAGRKLDE
jgi:hypothetical protein